MPSDGPFINNPFFEHGAALLTALGHRERLLILRILLTRELSLNVLALMTGIGVAACSDHLGALRGAGLVVCRRRSDTNYFSCRSEQVKKVLETLDDIWPVPPLQRTPANDISGTV